jgi:hypothetical protein
VGVGLLEEMPTHDFSIKSLKIVAKLRIFLKILRGLFAQTFNFAPQLVKEQQSF